MHFPVQNSVWVSSFFFPSTRSFRSLRVHSESSSFLPVFSLGRVIGKGGTKIKELADTSGARLKLIRYDDEVNDDTGQLVSFIGDPSLLRHASCLQECNGSATRISLPASVVANDMTYPTSFSDFF